MDKKFDIERYVSITDGGFYAWDIVENLFWADRRFAEIVGVDHAIIDKGLPAEGFLDLVHDDDRRALMEGMKTAIVDRKPFQMVYRILRGSKFVRISEYGQCLRAVDGVPTLFTGIIFESGDGMSDRVAGNENALS
jgi:PAS domain-containing protein